MVNRTDKGSGLSKIEEAKARAEKRLGCYKRLFNTPEGKIVLQDLADTFQRSALAVVGDPFMSHVRIGHHEVVQYIKDIMERDDAG